MKIFRRTHRILCQEFNITDQVELLLRVKRNPQLRDLCRCGVCPVRILWSVRKYEKRGQDPAL